MRVQRHDFNELWACTYCGVSWGKRDDLSCIFREVDAVVSLRPNPSPGIGYPSIDLDRLRIIREEGQEALKRSAE
jgi:hypothetical protein